MKARITKQRRKILDYIARQGGVSHTSELQAGTGVRSKRILKTMVDAGLLLNVHREYVRAVKGGFRPSYRLANIEKVPRRYRAAARRRIKTMRQWSWWVLAR